jgi:hypothetical protein
MNAQCEGVGTYAENLILIDVQTSLRIFLTIKP